MNIPIPKPKFRKRDLSKMLALLSLLALFTAPIWASTTAYGTPITINNPEPAANDSFGTAVSLSEDKILIGTPGNDTGAFNAGSAYLYDATSGALLQTFNNPAPASEDRFGNSVSISGNRVLIGAPYNDFGAFNAGSAYLYDATSGALLQTFNNPAPETSLYFGVSISISGDKMLIGSHNDDTGATDSGSAYLYDATSGTLLQTFNNPVPAEYDYFGTRVFLSEDRMLIGAPGDDTGTIDAGSVYLYDATSGTLLQTFHNPTPAPNDEFGRSVSISGDKVLIGADLDDTEGTNTGSAYLYDATTGELLHVINNPTPDGTDVFAYSASLSGDKVLIGAYLSDDGGTNVGSVYLYDATSGTLLQTFNNPMPEMGDAFGYSVFLSDNKFVVGTPNKNAGVFDNSGSAYLYLLQNDTDSDGIADSIDNCPADANANQTDTDSDEQGDICDFTPNGDTDGDNIDELIDNCAGVFNPVQEDLDSDGIGDACDPTPNGDPDPNPTSIDQCKQLDWMNFSFHNQGQCVAFVNTGHDSRQ